MTVMGDAVMNGLSDRGSIPLSSIFLSEFEELNNDRKIAGMLVCQGFQQFFCFRS